ncbi:adenylate cyclase [Suhomyces tanzawaensis NRRL Y-17324]|uniref:Adenylate cyclase n=1 Tax=Suhomyces tanzawaensis NRRL Y-17324 TaxID=984487 RepID=A0A1E4SM47_9ASCO|nr:adenylate cyclase [Suhomyces tanzawaensis NRRL Y-17324]ODV80604.1 adenylate cyclase [Suhomyces tanzawaensis NRRL Y-17324]
MSHVHTVTFHLAEITKGSITVNLQHLPPSMSFLRRDKSKTNLKPSFGFTAGQLPSHKDENHSVKRAHVSNDPNSPTTGTMVAAAAGANSGQLSPGSKQSGGHPGFSKRTSSTTISPIVSSNSSINSGNQPHARPDDVNALFTYAYDEENGASDSPLHTKDSASNFSQDNYSPRSSVVSFPMTHEEEEMASGDPVRSTTSNLKDNYRGFHANQHPRGGSNTPPLTHPIKPRFKKKSGSLLGKLIYSSRKEVEPVSELQSISPQNDAFYHPGGSDSRSRQNSVSNTNRSASVGSSNTHHQRKSASSTSSSSSKHKFRIPSISLDHHHHHNAASAPPAVTTPPLSSYIPTSANNSPHAVKSDSARPSLASSGTTFNLDMNLDEMKGIVKSPQNESTTSNDPILSKIKLPARHSVSNMALSYSNENISDAKGGSWKAPDSWDVKLDDPKRKEFDLFGSDDSDEKDRPNDKQQHYELDTSSSSSVTLASSIEGKTKKHKHTKKEELARLPSQLNLPVLYGSRQSSHIVPSPADAKNLTKGPNHTVRVFKEDNTFTTILCPLETTTAELLNIVQRKFFLDSTSNYQLSVYVGNSVKVLEPFEKPLKIQLGLLMLSGYTEADNFRIIGREDLSFVFKFVVENIFLRNLTHDEETLLSKDYVDVDISGLDLKNIPIIFHQHTYEIERLNVANNPSIYIPLDFIQSCNNLTSIVFSRNGASKFPMNFLEATKLTYLDMEKNFLDELPTKISHLRHLTHLKLNSNQLCHLPKSFGKLKNLISLNLSSNYFNSYPEPLSELTSLQDLDLSYNDLSELPESICKLTNLAKLNLCTNKLTKKLPKYLSKLTNLKRLDIRYNQISNVDVLGLLPNLEVTYASKNNISTFNDKMESLRLLHFDRNPTTNLQFKSLLNILTILDLSKAKITSIPAEFLTKIPNVEKFVLDKNHLVNLPNELGGLNKLVFLSIYGNNLQTLPSSIGQLSSLQYLDLHSNNLQTLPNEIWNLKSLSMLNISSNIMTSFPKPPFSVAKRILSSANFRNFVADPISGKDSPADSRRPSVHSPLQNDTPSSAGEFSSRIDIEGGDESDTIDKGELTEGSTQSLSFANTSSSLADCLMILTMADNRLSDDCFESISFLISLKSLNLSYNDFLEVPEGGLRRLTRLTELYLSGNELTTLPADDLENLKALKLLFVNNNKLVALPAELSKLTELQHLDVGSNQLKYNISNWPYDWSWHWNKNLKYLNFSGNKRFEIKQSHVKNPETGEDFDSLLVLKRLKVLGLIDVTLTSTSVPDQNNEMRIRTTASELDSIGYGVSDSMGMRDHVSSRDIFIQKFRGNEGELLVCSFDGKCGAPNQAHKISALAKALFVPNFTNELEKIKSDDEINDAIRRTFLSLNKEVNGILAAKQNNNLPPNVQIKQDFSDLSLRDDGNAGCAITIIYIKNKKLYTANIGDIEALLSRNNGDHIPLTHKHDPTNRHEFERIRASGGYVSGDGALDGDLTVSRGVGFFNYLPHTHSGPDISEISLTAADDVIVLATKILWDFISYELAVDILRQEKDDPMLAAQKLRDLAICYGASDKIAVIVVTLGEQKLSRLKFGSNALYHNLGRENDVYGAAKKRRDRFVTGDSQLRRLEEEIEPPVGELALVFTDIKNSTLLWDTYPASMRSAIKTHNSIMRRQLRIVGGYEVKTEGDAFMVSFPSPTSALLWCFNVQQNLLTADWPSEILETDQCCEVADSNGNVFFRGLSVRMGIHWGAPVCEPDVITGRMDYFGPMVNRTSRISAIADGGQIAVSSDFLDEIGALGKIHEDIKAGKISLMDAYQGNHRAGEIIEKELTSIEEVGCYYYTLGERKLKGLETPEPITLAFPEKLKIRQEMLQRSQNETSIGTRIVGTLPVDAIFKLRTVSLRLENVCSSINGGTLMNEGFLHQSSGDMIERNTAFKESDVVALLNHIVTRVEGCATTLQLRQDLSKVSGDNGRIAFAHGKGIGQVLEELSDFVLKYGELLNRTGE